MKKLLYSLLAAAAVTASTAPSFALSGSSRSEMGNTCEVLCASGQRRVIYQEW